MLHVHIIPALEVMGNYIYLLQDETSSQTAIVDPTLAAPVLTTLKEKKLSLNYILNTHHHWDHTDGNEEIKSHTGCTVIGYAKDEQRIPVMDKGVEEGDIFLLGESEASILFIPGHTRGHIAYWFAKDKTLFCGDTLFSVGCGRLFEGTPEQMLRSLEQLKALPDDTKIYCGHEYTVKNCEFALTVEPNNLALQERYTEAKKLTAKSLPTLPSTMIKEKETNPFLRTDSKEIRTMLGMEQARDVEIFAELRKRKDNF